MPARRFEAASAGPLPCLRDTSREGVGCRLSVATGAVSGSLGRDGLLFGIEVFDEVPRPGRVDV
jgi:hypothetical protein